MSTENTDLLKRFMQEHFPYGEFRRAGIFAKELRGDYRAQAARICARLSLSSIYEYGNEDIACHLTFAGDRPLHVNHLGVLRCEPFVTVVKNIYE